ncbi:NmrA family NAD(P)-binding protein [Motiliproteus sediminis]|uniref:NmrA family NAD(P)-binding protein n=1 Tax=Motiliproteus sediminis TaxID=1468178 RepID=UPI001AEF7BFA|nr:NmrA family NAD(P)-binding protein [Motiliproteus sediminis]
MNQHLQTTHEKKSIVVIGATGKTGRRVVDKLSQQGVAVHGVSRTSTPSFDWNDQTSWRDVIKGASAIYLTFAPDLAVPGSTQAIAAFVAMAREQQVQRLVLLSGRGEEEAQRCEQLVLESGIPSTVVRASWFNQNFSEGEFVAMVEQGTIALPAGNIAEPFIDIDDIADVVVTALLNPGHEGEVYEVTGPQLLTFNQIATELSAATGKQISYQPISLNQFNTSLAESGAPEEMRWLLNYLMETVLDGRNSSVGNGVQRALGRPPKSFSEFANAAFAQRNPSISS